MIASLVVVVTMLVLSAGACGGDPSPTSPSPSPDPAPSPSPSPGPGAVTASLGGLVTARGTSTRISDARVSILDGPNAGRTTTTSNGEYRFDRLEPGNANVSVTASGYNEARAGVVIQGAATLNVALTEIAPVVTFGPGQHRVGSAVAAGRYFADPAPGCYFERQSGTSGAAAETIAFDFVGFDAAQWIVEMLATDVAFQTNAACGTWSNRARGGLQAPIPPGMWLVGAQVLPGTYRATARAGCTWERLRDFTGTTGSVIATDFISTAGTTFVTIEGSDAGFMADEACGVWTRTDVAAAATVQGGSD